MIDNASYFMRIAAGKKTDTEIQTEKLPVCRFASRKEARRLFQFETRRLCISLQVPA
jgi:hypothetical protein